MEVDERDHVIGASSPTLTLVEYGDFACRFCFAAHRPVMSLLDRFDELRLVWRHLPDPELHPGADLAAELSELAAAHGKFWDAHALLLAGRERFAHQDLLAVAQELGIETKKPRPPSGSAASVSAFSPIWKVDNRPGSTEPRPSSSTVSDSRAHGASLGRSCRQG